MVFRQFSVAPSSPISNLYWAAGHALHQINISQAHFGTILHHLRIIGSSAAQKPSQIIGRFCPHKSKSMSLSTPKRNHHRNHFHFVLTNTTHTAQILHLLSGPPNHSSAHCWNRWENCINQLNLATSQGFSLECFQTVCSLSRKWETTNARTILHVLNGSSLTPSHLDFSVGINHVLSCQSSCLIGIRKELRNQSQDLWHVLSRWFGSKTVACNSDKDNQALGLPATTKVFAPWYNMSDSTNGSSACVFKQLPLKSSRDMHLVLSYEQSQHVLISVYGSYFMIFAYSCLGVVFAQHWQARSGW